MFYHFLALTGAVILNATANLLLKFASRDLNLGEGLLAQGWPNAVKTLILCPKFTAGLILFALNVVLYFYALGRFKVSLAYPIMVGAGFAIIVTVAAFSGLNERLSALQWFGVAMILCGVVAVSVSANQ